MSREKPPAIPAVRVLRAAGESFADRLCDREARGILDLPRTGTGGGSRGDLAGIAPAVLIGGLAATRVEAVQ